MFEIALLAMSLTLAGEKSFFHFPDGYEFRFQKISRADKEGGWAFSVDSGYLGCAWGMGQRITGFNTDPSPDEPEKVRLLVLSPDPFQLVFSNIANADLFAPSNSVEERIKLVGPFTDMAQKLCNQPAGTRVGDGGI
jgi:hypothetical protein